MLITPVHFPLEILQYNGLGHLRGHWICHRAYLENPLFRSMLIGFHPVFHRPDSLILPLALMNFILFIQSFLEHLLIIRLLTRCKLLRRYSLAPAVPCPVKILGRPLRVYVASLAQIEVPAVMLR